MEAIYLIETGLQLSEDVGHGCCGVRQDQVRVNVDVNVVYQK